MLKSISRALTGNPDGYMVTEEKILPIYNYEKKADIDTKKDVFVAALGAKVEVLARKTMEDKTQLNPATGKYDPIPESRTYVEIKSWLDPETHKTYNETMSNSEPKQYKAFMEKIAVEPILDNRELSKEAGTGTETPPPTYNEGANPFA